MVVAKGFPGGVVGKKPTCQCRRLGFDPWVGSIPWRRKWQPNPLQYSCLENPMDRGVWWAAAHGVTKSQTRLSPHTQVQSFSFGDGRVFKIYCTTMSTYLTLLNLTLNEDGKFNVVCGFFFYHDGLCFFSSSSLKGANFHLETQILKKVGGRFLGFARSSES